MLKETLEEFGPFLDTTFSFVDELGIDVSDLEIDHAALRFKDSDGVDTLSHELRARAAVLGEAVVNGRKIYIFKLDDPIVYRQYQIPCIELPYPASDHDFPRDGWEHVEFVLPAQDVDSLEQIFRKRFPSLTDEMLTKYRYRLSVPKVEGEQLPNPTIVLTRDKGLSIKFHPYSIERVVTSKL